MSRSFDNKLVKWTFSIGGPLLSIISFVILYFLDPLNFGIQQPMAAIPAFMLSIIILIISQSINTDYEINKTNRYSSSIYEAIKNYIHVTTVGSPEKAYEYVMSRIPSLREVKNTSFNLDFENEISNEKFYETRIYEEASKLIAFHCTMKLLWKDIGDPYARKRFQMISKLSKQISQKTNYKYKFIAHNEPQIDFIILEFMDSNREVLFNWDFRGLGQDPTVLISRDEKIIEMFSIHFTHLWRSGSIDHDRIETKSTSVK